VGETYRLVCGSSTLEMTPQRIVLDCGGSQIELLPGQITIRAALVKVN